MNVTYLLDTNCLISYVTDRNPRQREIVAAYIERAARLDVRMEVIGVTLSEVAYVLQRIYAIGTDTIAEMIADLASTPGMTIQDCFSVFRLLKLWPRGVPDFGDAVLCAAAQERGTHILTFDVRFAKALAKVGVAHTLLR